MSVLSFFTSILKVLLNCSPPLNGVLEPPTLWFYGCLNFWILQKIMFKTAKKKKGMVVGFVSFENAGQVKSASEVPLFL